MCERVAAGGGCHQAEEESEFIFNSTSHLFCANIAPTTSSSRRGAGRGTEERSTRAYFAEGEFCSNKGVGDLALWFKSGKL